MLLCRSSAKFPQIQAYFSLFRLITESAARVVAKNLARESFHGSGGGCLGDMLGVSLSPAGFEKSSRQGCLTRSGACA